MNHAGFINKQSLLKLSAALFAIVLIVMPFHASIVTIIGNFVVQKAFIQAWKEIVIALVVALTFIAYIKDRSILKIDITNILVIAIIVLSLLISLFAGTNKITLAAGIKTNLVVLVLFLSVQTFSKYYHFHFIKWAVLIPAFVVGAIAIVQPYILKPDLLNKIGYGSNSIISGQFVESTNDSVQRVFSTLGGPNQLGAYLIIPLILSLSLALKKKQWYWWLAFTFFALPLFMTYSRSSWLGAIFATIATIMLTLPKKIQIAAILSGAVVSVIALVFVFSGSFCSPQFQSVSSKLIHGDCKNGVLGGSDSIRVKSLKDGVKTSLLNPIGKGLGTAGPASYYSKSPIITENWYLQIAIEVGFVGLTGYLAFYLLTFKNLYTQINSHSFNSIFSLSLFGALAGILVSALFLHTLADSTLSIILFGLLGLQKGGVKT